MGRVLCILSLRTVDGQLWQHNDMAGWLQLGLRCVPVCRACVLGAEQLSGQQLRMRSLTPCQLSVGDCYCHCGYIMLTVLASGPAEDAQSGQSLQGHQPWLQACGQRAMTTGLSGAVLAAPRI